MGATISVCITFHAEAGYVEATLRSVGEFVDGARRANISVDIAVCLDSATDETTRIVESWRGWLCEYTIYKQSFGDAGLSRNFLVQVSGGTYIAFVDGDDLFGENWLTASYRTAQSHPEPVLCIPQHGILFGNGTMSVLRQRSSHDALVSEANAVYANPWMSQNFVHRTILEAIPYTLNTERYGYEDWRWNLDVIAAGYKSVAVADTVFFYRQKYARSSNQGHVAQSKTVGTSLLFQPQEFLKLPYTSSSKLMPRYSSIQVNTVQSSQLRIYQARRRIRQLILSRYGYRLFYRSIQTLYHGMHRLLLPALLRFKGSSAIVDNQGVEIVNKHGSLYPLSQILSPQQQGLYKKVAAIEAVLGNLGQVVLYHEMSYPQPTTDFFWDLCALHPKIFPDHVVVLSSLEMNHPDTRLLEQMVRQYSRNDQRTLIVVTVATRPDIMQYFRSIPGVTVGYAAAHRGITEQQQADTLLAIIDNWPLQSVSFLTGNVSRYLIGKYGTRIRTVVPIRYIAGTKNSLSNLIGDIRAQDTLIHTVPDIPKATNRTLLALKCRIERLQPVMPELRDNQLPQTLPIYRRGDPKVTVILPVYNAAYTLGESIESILTQTYGNFNLWIINDGSIDQSGVIADKYAARDPRITVFHQSNQGLVETLNHFVKKARTRYVARMDADDVSTPDRLEKQMRYLINNPQCGVVGCLTRDMTSTGKLGRVFARPSSPKALSFWGGYCCQLAGPSIVARRDCLVGAGLFKDHEYPAEDFGLWTRVARAGHYELALLPEVLYHYRNSGTGISAGNTDVQRQATVRIGDYHRKQLIDSAVAYYDPEIFNNWIAVASQLSRKAGRRFMREYLMIASWYIADHWAINPPAARRATRRMQHTIRRRMPVLTDDFETLLHEVLVEHMPYGLRQAKVPKRLHGSSRIARLASIIIVKDVIDAQQASQLIRDRYKVKSVCATFVPTSSQSIFQTLVVSKDTYITPILIPDNYTCGQILDSLLNVVETPYYYKVTDTADILRLTDKYLTAAATTILQDSINDDGLTSAAFARYAVNDSKLGYQAK